MLLSDTEHVISASQGLPLSPAAFPSLSEASQRQPTASTNSSSSQQQQQQHPLKPYWEYLSFLFRRQPEPKPDQMLELSYRDYLQVLHFVFTMFDHHRLKQGGQERSVVCVAMSVIQLGWVVEDWELVHQAVLHMVPSPCCLPSMLLLLLLPPSSLLLHRVRMTVSELCLVATSCLVMQGAEG